MSKLIHLVFCHGGIKINTRIRYCSHGPRSTNPSVSIVSSELAFSVGNRVLNPKRSRLQHMTLEICICFKDWSDAKFDEQGIDLYDESSESEHNDSVGSSITQ